MIYDEHGGFYDHVIPPSATYRTPMESIRRRPGPRLSSAPSLPSTGLAFVCRRSSPRPGFRPARSTRHNISTRRCWRRSKRFSVFPRFLTKRDASANSFDGLFSELSSPRTDTPKRYPGRPCRRDGSTTDPSHPASHLTGRHAVRDPRWCAPDAARRHTPNYAMVWTCG